MMIDIYNCSLENIARDLANSGALSALDQELICNRWGRTLDNLTDDERAYIEYACLEYKTAH